jgi:hypothetical protein
MNTTELGVYILAAAGIATGDHLVVLFAALSAGAAYLAQLCAAIMVDRRLEWLAIPNIGAMAISLLCWLYGVVHLI